ncbi:MAG: hypothetical protein MHM6MM_003776 [Cercozoa sp. M6MM]
MRTEQLPTVLRLLAVLLLAIPATRGTLMSSSTLNMCIDSGEDFQCDNKVVVTLTVGADQQHTERIQLNSITDMRENSETYDQRIDLNEAIEITFSKEKPVIRYGLQFVRFVNWVTSSRMPGSPRPNCDAFVPFMDEETGEIITGTGVCCGCSGSGLGHTARREPFTQGCDLLGEAASSTLQYVLHPTWAAVYKVLPPTLVFDVYVRINDPEGVVFNGTDPMGDKDVTQVGDWVKVEGGSLNSDSNIWEARVGPTRRIASSPIGSIKLVGDFASYTASPMMEGVYVVARAVDIVETLLEECEIARSSGEFGRVEDWLVLPQHEFSPECNRVGVSYDAWYTVGGTGDFCDKKANTCLHNQLSDKFNEYLDAEKKRHKYGIEAQYSTIYLVGSSSDGDASDGMSADNLWQGPAWNKYDHPLPISDEDIANGKYTAHFDTRLRGSSSGDSVITLTLNADNIVYTQMVADGFFERVSVPEEYYNVTASMERSVVQAVVRNNDTIIGDFYVSMHCDDGGSLQPMQSIMRSVHANSTSLFVFSPYDTQTNGGNYTCSLKLRNTLGRVIDTALTNIAFKEKIFVPPVPDNSTTGIDGGNINSPGKSSNNDVCSTKCKSAFDLPCLLLHGCWEAFMSLAVIAVLLCCCLPALVRFCSKRSAKTLQAFASGVSVLARPSEWRRRRRRRDESSDSGNDEDPKSPLVTHSRNQTMDVAQTPSALNTSISLASALYDHNRSSSFGSMDSLPGTPMNASYFVMTPRNNGNITGNLTLDNTFDTNASNGTPRRPPSLSLDV